MTLQVVLYTRGSEGLSVEGVLGGGGNVGFNSM